MYLLKLIYLQFYAELFVAMGIRVLEIHSRKNQRQRTQISDEFRDGHNLVLFTSDVSARGMDYPDVTRVVQVKWVLCMDTEHILYTTLSIHNTFYAEHILFFEFEVWTTPMSRVLFR